MTRISSQQNCHIQYGGDVDTSQRWANPWKVALCVCMCVCVCVSLLLSLTWPGPCPCWGVGRRTAHRWAAPPDTPAYRSVPARPVWPAERWAGATSPDRGRSPDHTTDTHQYCRPPQQQSRYINKVRYGGLSDLFHLDLYTSTKVKKYIIEYMVGAVPGSQWRRWLSAASPHRWTRRAGRAQSDHTNIQQVKEEVSGEDTLHERVSLYVIFWVLSTVWNFKQRGPTTEALLCTKWLCVKGERRVGGGEGREGARAKLEPGRLQLATDHEAYEALRLVCGTRPLFRIARRSTTNKRSRTRLLNMHGPRREDGTRSCLFYCHSSSI